MSSLSLRERARVRAVLWDQQTCPPWHEALQRYPVAVATYGSSRLAELDRWLRLELLPSVIARSGGSSGGRVGDVAIWEGRPMPFITLQELVWATEWKMLRGVWRPRNLQLVRGNPPAEVERLSAEALEAVPDPKRPLALLARLAGVGPATASAVLATAAPSAYPFFDEVVAAQIPGLGPAAFTTAYYYRYADALRRRAGNLAAVCTHSPWPVHDLDLALWSVVDGTKPAPVSPALPASPR